MPPALAPAVAFAISTALDAAKVVAAMIKANTVTIDEVEAAINERHASDDVRRSTMAAIKARLDAGE